MFQSQVKKEFVLRYCRPDQGWKVFVDIDASEEGLTGGERKSEASRKRQEDMKTAGARVREELHDLGVATRDGRSGWFAKHQIPLVGGDRDIVAFHPVAKRYLVVEVEGVSGGQPEMKVYKAVGQIVVAASQPPLQGWQRRFVVVVTGNDVACHLERAHALEALGVSGLALAIDPREDRWLFGPPCEKFRLEVPAAIFT